MHTGNATFQFGRLRCQALRALAVSFLLAAGCAVAAHAWTHQWSIGRGATGADRGGRVAVDGAGNVVFAGLFTDSLNLGGSRLTSHGGQDIYLARFDASGGHLWSRRFGGLQNETVNGLAVSPTGIFLFGTFRDTIDCGGGPLIGQGNTDLFLAAFDAAGNHLWSKRFGDASAQLAAGLAVDTSGNLLITGSFAGAVNFGGSLLTSAGATDIFLAKLTGNGVHLWSKRFGDGTTQLASAVATDGGDNVLLAGVNTGSVNFGGPILTTAGGQDIVLARFNSAGAHSWSRQYGSTDDQIAADVTADATGNVVLGCSYRGSVDFGGGPLSSAGSFDIGLVKLDAAGSHVWSRNFGDAGEQRVAAVALDSSGNVLLTGFFLSPVDFGGGALTPSPGFMNLYLAEFDAGGAHVESRGFGSQDSRGEDVAAGPGGEILLTGGFNSTVDFGGGPIPSAGLEDMFLVKLLAAASGVADARPPISELRMAPNPTHRSATVYFTLRAPGRVELSVYDAQGRRVACLAAGPWTAGSHSIAWDRHGADGRPVPDGVYYLRVKAPGLSTAGKLVLVGGPSR